MQWSKVCFFECSQGGISLFGAQPFGAQPFGWNLYLQKDLVQSLSGFHQPVDRSVLFGQGLGYIKILLPRCSL